MLLVDELLPHVVDEFSSPLTFIDGTRVLVCSHADRREKKLLLAIIKLFANSFPTKLRLNTFSLR